MGCQPQRLGFVILTWNSEKDICTCLDSVLSLACAYTLSVIVVDNGSTDSTVALLQSYGGQIEAVFLEKNYGTTYPRNCGLKKLAGRCDYVCVLDSDTRVNQAAFDEMISYLKNHPACGIVGPKLCSFDGRPQMSGRNIPTAWIKLCKGIPVCRIQRYAENLERVVPQDNSGPYPVGYLMSACWLMPNAVLDEVGYLDERIFYAPEDVEYCIRAGLRGYTIMMLPQVHIIHKWQRISKKKLISKLNWLHIKGLGYLFLKYHYFLSAGRLQKKIKACQQERVRLTGEHHSKNL